MRLRDVGVEERGLHHRDEAARHWCRPIESRYSERVFRQLLRLSKFQVPTKNRLDLKIFYAKCQLKHGGVPNTKSIAKHSL